MRQWLETWTGLAIAQAARFLRFFRQACAKALEHDALNLAQSCAYSAIIALFPAMVVTAALIALLPDVAPLKIEIGEFFDEVLPSSTFSLLTSYFVSTPGTPHPNTIRTLILAALVSVSGGSSVLVSLMEGVRRSYGLPVDAWKGLRRRVRALVMVPLSLLPLLVATLLVVFGRFMTEWLASFIAPSFQPVFFAMTLALRWIVSLAGVAGLTASIYHFGVPVRPRRRIDSLPGAIVATAIWFGSTLAFGWYVTRFANYSLVYGSLGAGIALLFWLYLVFLSVLVGAEFNAQVSQVQKSVFTQTSLHSVKQTTQEQAVSAGGS